jgi:hypothetical protein
VSAAGAFPTLRTGAVVQYPSSRELRFRTEVSRFVDGSEQRFRQFASGHVRWIVRLDLLTDAELQAVADFHLTHRGRAAVFSFTDPWTGTEYPTCCFESDDLEAEAVSESQNKTEFVIRSTQE